MKSTPHDSSYTHVRGESEFVDDAPMVAGELFVSPILSAIAHGKIKKISYKKALDIPGVVGIYTAKDLKHNLWGTVMQDQPILADDKVNYHGEPICILACKDLWSLREAKALIEVEIETLPPILSIAEARRQNSFIAPKRFIERGECEQALKESPYRLQGVLTMAGQEHFYLESQASIAYPEEQGQIRVLTSSQHPTEVQHVVAHCLGLNYHEVVCEVKRMGGGFGGKESQAVPFAVMAALVAQKTGCPARVILSKDDDMKATGKRNPFESHYEVGFDDAGRIKALKVDLYSNSGAYADLSTAIMERAMLHTDNAYFLPNVKISGQVCRTNQAPTTAFRGFGGPKGVATIENIIEEIAIHLNKDAYEIRRLNCYQGAANIAPYGQKIEQEILPRLFDQLYKDCEYKKRREQIKEFNSSSLTQVKGLSLTAVKFGISFTTRFLNQGAAQVNLHMDGTLQVSTGATEMGQGVNTKIAQAVAEVFQIPVEQVKVMKTSTEKIHNTSPTAASSGSDINGSAAQMAARIIKKRLQLVADKIFQRPKELMGRKVASMGLTSEIQIDEHSQAEHIIFANGEVYNEKNPEQKISFQQLIEEAYLNRISLGAYSYFRYPGIYFNKETGQGEPFFYFTNGVAASEVLLDRFTGELKILRTDILMDLGRPLNEGIDYGQTCGAFIQGVGWVTTEKLFYNKQGVLLTHSPSTYKIPSIQDIPREFNINFLKNDENKKNLLGSKAVGEPPLLLGISVWTAIKNALSYNDKKNRGIPKINLPATQEEILMQLP